MMFVSLLKTSEGFFLVLTQDRNIRVFESRGDGLRYYEDSYTRAHRRNYEGSMSACVNWMQFQPSIVEVEEPVLENIAAKILDPALSVVALNSASGHYVVACTRPEAEQLWDEGVKPRLISSVT